MQGSIRAIDVDGGDYTVHVGDVYLCRCGASQTKPFRDGTHARIGFQAPERVPGPYPRDDPVATHNGPDRLEVSNQQKRGKP